MGYFDEVGHGHVAKDVQRPAQGLVPGAGGPGAMEPGTTFGSRLCHLPAAGSAQSLHLQNMSLLLSPVVRIK